MENLSMYAAFIVVRVVCKGDYSQRLQNAPSDTRQIYNNGTRKIM